MESKIKTEVHTHTIASQHAYSTVYELVERCKQLGFSLLAITDHGPGLPEDGANHWHFSCLKLLPRKIDSLYLIRGAETNIMDLEGNVDLSEEILKRLDWVIASVHLPCITPGSIEENTHAYLKVIENPYIDAIGHSGTPEFAYDIDVVLKAAKEHNKVIEINNHTFNMRKKSIENCHAIARRCAELGVKVALSTDAHSVYQLGNTEHCWNLATEVGIQESQIVNLTAESMLSYICSRRGYDRDMFESTQP